VLLRLRSRIRALFRRDRIDDEMQLEIRSHLARAAEQLQQRGMSARAAAAQARREFGNVPLIEEEARDARGWRRVGDLVQDLRYVVRGLRHKPGFVVAVVSTLALGVGANATMFAIVDRLLFRTPPYLIAAERSHHIYFHRFMDGQEQLGQAYPYQRFLDLTKATSTMEVMAAYAQRTLAVGSATDAEETLVAATSASFWRLFDARPQLGRFFTTEEDNETESARVAVLSHDYWQSRFGGSPDVVGATIIIAPARYTIIGVAPRGFVGVERDTPGIFIPIAIAAVDDFGPMWNGARSSYAMSWLELYGRRRADVPVERATNDLTAAFRASYRTQMQQEPQFTPPIDEARPRMLLASMLNERGPRPSADARVATWLFGVTVIVLLIACANVGNLLLTRALGRRREIAVRLALGVSRGRLTRYLLLESLVLAAIGGLTGLMVAHWGEQLMRAFLMPGAAWRSPIADPRTVLFACIATLLVGIATAAVPLAQASRYDVVSALRAGVRDGHGRRGVLRATLTVAQLTLSVVLLIGAGLFVRSLDRVSDLRLGYDVGRLIVMDLRMRSTELDSAGQVALRRALMERASRSPNVDGVTLACSVPFSGTCTRRVFVDGIDATRQFGEFVRQVGSPSYFATVGTRIRRGRGLTSEDVPGAPLAAVVSEAMAEALWPNADPLGMCFRIGADTAPCRIVVGVAENVRQERLGDDSGLQFYLPAAQDGEHRGRLLVRVHGDPAARVEPLRRELARVMPASGYLVVRPMTRIIDSVSRPWRLGAVMFVVFGGLALAVAAIGLYSVVAYGVAQRSHEVGVRIALGADGRAVVGLVLREGVRVVIVGVAIGLSIAFAAGPWVDPLLFEISPRDPFVFGTVATVLAIVGLAASTVPAIRASRTDPVTTLRAD
jgi:putative ABC transport system permease protein